MSKALPILAVLAILLTSGLLVRSGRPYVCINSNIVHNISIVNSSQSLEACASGSRGMIGGTELSFWEAKKIAQNLERLNFIPRVARVKQLELLVNLDPGAEFKSKNNVWELSVGELQNPSNFNRSLIEYWVQLSYPQLNDFHKSLYVELILKIVMQQESDFAGYINSWATGPYDFTGYCHFDRLSLQATDFCLSYFKSKKLEEGSFVSRQAWGLQYFVAQVFSNYYDKLSPQKQKEFKHDLLNLKSPFSISTVKIIKSKSFSQRKKSVRGYFWGVFLQITGEKLPVKFIKIMDDYGLSDRVLSVSVE